MNLKQRLQIKFIGIVLIMGVFFLSVPIRSVAENTQHQKNAIYAELLAMHVQNGVVNYAGFKKDEKKLDQYLVILESSDVNTLNRDGQMAFYINAYNAWTIKLILSGYPGVESIKDLGGFFSGPWKKEFVRLKGETVTLDHIEHDILRPTYKDPRVHFAVNCASKGCPLLIAEPYDGSRLDEQLDRSTREFINDPERNYLAEDNLYVSKIFKWFSEDFNDDVIGFIIQYADEPLKKQLQAQQDRIKVKYLDYDWSLNGR
jgi:L-rhamnose mutarotase